MVFIVPKGVLKVAEFMTFFKLSAEDYEEIEKRKVGRPEKEKTPIESYESMREWKDELWLKPHYWGGILGTQSWSEIYADLAHKKAKTADEFGDWQDLFERMYDELWVEGKIFRYIRDDLIGTFDEKMANNMMSKTLYWLIDEERKIGKKRSYEKEHRISMEELYMREEGGQTFADFIGGLDKAYRDVEGRVELEKLMTSLDSDVKDAVEMILYNFSEGLSEEELWTNIENKTGKPVEYLVDKIFNNAELRGFLDVGGSGYDVEKKDDAIFVSESKLNVFD